MLYLLKHFYFFFFSLRSITHLPSPTNDRIDGSFHYTLSTIHIPQMYTRKDNLLLFRHSLTRPLLPWPATLLPQPSNSHSMNVSSIWFMAKVTFNVISVYYLERELAHLSGVGHNMYSHISIWCRYTQTHTHAQWSSLNLYFSFDDCVVIMMKVMNV